MNVTCRYCGGPAQLSTGRQIYPTKPLLAHLKLWVCLPCDAWVGCYEDSDRPRGPLADKKLRVARENLHDEMEPICRLMMEQRGGDIESVRQKMLGWLVAQLNLPPDMAAVSRIEYEDCIRALVLCKDLMRQLETKYGTGSMLRN